MKKYLIIYSVLFLLGTVIYAMENPSFAKFSTYLLYVGGLIGISLAYTIGKSLDSTEPVGMPLSKNPPPPRRTEDIKQDPGTDFEGMSTKEINIRILKNYARINGYALEYDTNQPQFLVISLMNKGIEIASICTLNWEVDGMITNSDRYLEQLKLIYKSTEERVVKDIKELLIYE